MTSVGESSTNDVSSTHVSSSNTSFAHTEAPAGQPHTASNVLTQDKIIKECIRQGFYRTPLCNEKLYLHNKGFDDIHHSAFDMYTDVKVLWLEGNGLHKLRIGGTYIQTKPPQHRLNYLDEKEAATEGESEEKVGGSDPTQQEGVKSSYVDPMMGLGPQAENERKSSTQNGREKNLPEITQVDAAYKDCFSSLYPTVRQLYLHNNILRTMPDFSRFEQLDSLNLANNFFHKIDPFCEFLERNNLESDEVSPYGQNEAQKTNENEVQVQIPQKKDEEEKKRLEKLGRRGTDDNDDAEIAIVAAAPSAEERKLELGNYAQALENLESLCVHETLQLSEDGAIPAKIPLSQRQPCSTLRSLNVSGNKIETFDDFVGLRCYKSLTTLDLSENNIQDGEALLLVLERLPCLKSLKLTGNPLIRKLKRYRQTVLSRCVHLLYLDDRPVFEEERRLVTAWTKGGDAGVAAERDAIKKENEAKQEKRLEDFRQLLSAHRESPAAKSYIAAISNGKDGTADANNDDDTSSSTSSETDYSDEKDGEKEEGNEADGSEQVSAVNVQRVEEDKRVLSSNGVRKNQNPASNDNKDDSEEDIYIPKS